MEPDVAISAPDLRTIWMALLIAQDCMVIPDGFDPGDNPAAVVQRARTIVEAAMAGSDGQGYHDV